MNRLNRNGERIPPCLTPQLMGKVEGLDELSDGMIPEDES